ncbi:MAG TPA: carboxypeptidase-like regulatory domain-containing protein [Thermoanaerobaculia bacterium]|nr:carboxypeptidase-like regulatory domain-containing protein [Thermoanaerobaculia bacterium]
MTLLVAGAAWAVAGRVSLAVEAPDGSALQGATISLDGVEIGTTDSSGQLEFEAEEGDHRMVIEHPDHGRTETTIAVPAGGTVTETVRMRRPAQQPPSRTDAGGRTGFGVQVSSDSSELEVQSGTITEKVFVDDDSEPVIDETTRVDPAQENAALAKTLEVTSVAVEVAWSFFGGGPSLSLRGPESSFAAPGGSQPGLAFFDAQQRSLFEARRRYGAEEGELPPQRRFRPTLSAWVGEAEVELEVDGRQDPTIHFVFEEEGLLWGVGLDLVWLLCDDCGWHLGAGARYQTVEDLEADRDTPRQIEGATTLRDRAELEYEAQQAQLLVGYGFRRVALYAGARWHRRELTFRGEQVFDFSERFGLPVRDEVTSIVEEDAEEIEGLVGAVVRFGDSRFYGRVEAASDGDNETVTAGMTVALGRRR